MIVSNQGIVHEMRANYALALRRRPGEGVGVSGAVLEKVEYLLSSSAIKASTSLDREGFT